MSTIPNGQPAYALHVMQLDTLLQAFIQQATAMRYTLATLNDAVQREVAAAAQSSASAPPGTDGPEHLYEAGPPPADAAGGVRAPAAPVAAPSMRGVATFGDTIPLTDA